MKRLLNLFLMLTMFVVNAAAVDYPIEVGGVKITSSNANDVLGDGTVSYNASTHTLTLNNANFLNLSNNLTETLTINVIGTNYMHQSYSSTSDGGDIVITGKGKLYTGEIKISNGNLLITDKAFVSARGMIVIYGGDLVLNNSACLFIDETVVYALDLRGGNLSVLDNAELYAWGNYDYKTFSGIKELTMGKDFLIWPKGISYSSGNRSFVDKSGKLYMRAIRIYNASRYQKYMLSIEGTQLDEINAKDVYGDGPYGNGSVKYYNTTKELTLNYANLSGVCNVIHDYDYNETVTIDLMGNNTVKANYDALSSDGASYIITGDGTLDVNGINLDEGNLTIKDKTKVNVLKSTSFAINLRGADLSVLDNAALCVDGNGKDATLLGVKNLTLAEGFQIYPSNLSYSSAKQGIVDETGNFTKGNVKIYNADNHKKYQLQINGIQLDEINAADFLGDGSVTYNDETKTLTLNNANLVRGSDALYFRDSEKLIIKLVGNSTIKANSTAIRGYRSKLIITGSGTLNVSGIDLTNCDLTIGNYAKVNVLKNTSYGINLHGGELVMQDKAELNVEGNGTSASISQVNNLTLAEGLGISPKNISYSSTMHGFVDESGNLTKGDIKIYYDSSFILYDLWIAGTQVSAANANDVFGDGTVKVEPGDDYYSVILANANIVSSSNAQKGIIYSTSEVYIWCTGNNRIEAQGDVNAAIYNEKLVYISWYDSGATLNIKGNINGINAPSVTIKNISMNIEGLSYRGICGFRGDPDGSLMIDIDFWNFDPIVKVKGGIGDFAEITLGNGVKMNAAEDICIYDFGVTTPDYSIVTNNSQHNIYRDEITFSCKNSTTSISGIQSSETTDAPAYDLMGRKVNGSYRGIVIKNGQKMMVK